MSTLNTDRMTKEDAAHYLGISQSTLNRMIVKREITYYQPVKGGRIWFKRQDLDRWFEAGKVRSA